MKIVTWNINSLNLRIELLKKFAYMVKPDIICLQETKSTDQNFPVEKIIDMGYRHFVFRGEKSYNGVAILSKYPILESLKLKIYNDDARYISIKIKNLEIINIYVPAGGEVPDQLTNPKFKHKLEFLFLFKKWFLANKSSDDNVVLLGDFNIAPYTNDVWSSRSLRNVVSHTSIERNNLVSLKDDLGFIDSFRYFIEQEKKLYSWWSYRNKNWKKSNRGRRLDHIWVSYNLEKKLEFVEMFPEVRDWPRTSDHIPCLLKLKI